MHSVRRCLPFRSLDTYCFARRHISERLKARMAATGPLKPMNVVLDGPNELEKLLPPDVEEAHRAACANGADMYTDPKTGLMVFTRLAHINKAKCCGCRCRHCPYGHINVPASKRPAPTAPSSTPSAAASSSSVQEEGAPVISTATAASTTAAAVKKSGVYTKTGDRGTTSLFSGERRPKTDLVFHALGTVDELNSHVGLARAYVEKEASFPLQEELLQALLDVQRRLLHCGALVATPGELAPLEHQPDEWTAQLESLIDRMDNTLPPLSSFILPGGSVASGQLHVCRSTCRRAERAVVDLLHRDEQLYRETPHKAAVYLNRLSDFFFVAARRAAPPEQETKWDKTSS